MSVRKGYLTLAIQSLRAARTRSFMTMLGIVIGVVSVIVIVSISEGVKQQIGNQAARYGRDVLLVRPNEASSSFTGSGLPGGAGTLLSSADVEKVRATAGVLQAVPISSVRGSVAGDFTLENPLVLATSPELGRILNQKILYGGFFAPEDGEHTAVLGATVARQLFQDAAPLGQKFTFRNQEFMVAGVFKEFMAAPFSLEANYNEAIFVPLTSAQAILGTPPPIQQIFVKVQPQVDATATARAIENTLREAHGGSTDAVALAPGAKGSASDQTLRLLTLMTVGVATVALVVGGVGIMNMMLVSVTERIHEIGLRKAIGATNRQILRQFVTEAFALCVVGALLGVILSFITIGLLRLYTSLQPVFVWQVVVLAPLVALATGVFFGSIPALKAARMDPIEALRHE